jgi:hypothetical protein
MVIYKIKNISKYEVKIICKNFVYRFTISLFNIYTVS